MYCQKKVIDCIFFTLLITLLYVNPVCSEMEYFPGLRRPPNWAQSQAAADEASDLLAQLIEEQARRRFQQQLAQQHYYQYNHQQRGPNAQNAISVAAMAANTPSFTYSFPENINGQSGNNNLNDNIPFAVNPSDPRYYDESIDLNLNPNLNMNNNNNNNKNNYQNNNNNKLYNPNIQNSENHLNLKLNGNVVPYSRLKPPMEINPKMPSTINNNNFNHVRHDINALVNKLEREGQVSAIINDNDNNVHQKNDVTRKHMGMEGEMGMYAVALIAGVSAAITVGLIALGIGWYTLQKRTKAAADVDYPAYGVTGPSKDISPSGDRRLAQSAQMYHYQHQKQQIIAMENRTSGEHAGGISDVESDDDNDEGDYTVYECPGLAPTGEMEVKNPLFLDDTPVTPSNNIVDGQATQSQQQQQQQQQQSQQTQQQQQQQQQQMSTQSPSKQQLQNSKKSSKLSYQGTQHQQKLNDDTSKKNTTGK